MQFALSRTRTLALARSRCPYRLPKSVGQLNRSRVWVVTRSLWKPAMSGGIPPVRRRRRRCRRTRPPRRARSRARSTAAGPRSRSGQPLPGRYSRASKSMGSNGAQRPPQIVVEPPNRRCRYRCSGLCRRSSATSPSYRACVSSSLANAPNSTTSTERSCHRNSSAKLMPAAPPPMTHMSGRKQVPFFDQTSRRRSFNNSRASRPIVATRRDDHAPPPPMPTYSSITTRVRHIERAVSAVYSNNPRCEDFERKLTIVKRPPFRREPLPQRRFPTQPGECVCETLSCPPAARRLHFSHLRELREWHRPDCTRPARPPSGPQG